MQQYRICRTYDAVVLEAGRYLGKSVLPAFIERVRAKGSAWSFYGALMSDGRPVVRVLQACRLSSGFYVVRDRTNTRDPEWSWVAEAERVRSGQDLLPSPVFRTGNDLVRDRRRAVVPEYARPDVPSGE